MGVKHLYIRSARTVYTLRITVPDLKVNVIVPNKMNPASASFYIPNPAVIFLHIKIAISLLG